MSRSPRKALTSALTVAVLAAGSLTLATGAAEAAVIPPCDSPPLTGCVLIENHTRNVNSVRLRTTQPNGRVWTRCLTGTRPGRESAYPDVWFSGRDWVVTTGYTGTRCESGSKVSVRTNWTQPDAYQYWTLDLYQN